MDQPAGPLVWASHGPKKSMTIQDFRLQTCNHRLSPIQTQLILKVQSKISLHLCWKFIWLCWNFCNWVFVRDILRLIYIYIYIIECNWLFFKRKKYIYFEIIVFFFFKKKLDLRTSLFGLRDPRDWDRLIY